MTLLIIAVLFGLSLLSAWVLFNKLKSTAVVKEPKYQLGGAVAGFVVVLSILAATYIKIDATKKQYDMTELQKRCATAEAKVRELEVCRTELGLETTYKGKVEPYVKDAYVVLGVTEGIIYRDGTNGTFQLRAKRVTRPLDGPSLYVIDMNHLPAHKLLTERDDLNNLIIAH